MSNEFNIILPDNPCRKSEVGRFAIWSRELITNTLVMIFNSRRTFDKDGPWYWKNDIPRTLRTTTRLLIILEDLETLSTEMSRMILGFKDPEIEYLETK